MITKPNQEIYFQKKTKIVLRWYWYDNYQAKIVFIGREEIWADILLKLRGICPHSARNQPDEDDEEDDIDEDDSLNLRVRKVLIAQCLWLWSILSLLSPLCLPLPDRCQILTINNPLLVTSHFWIQLHPRNCLRKGDISERQQGNKMHPMFISGCQRIVMDFKVEARCHY